MSKVICEICGTVYPDNATVCPICGYPRNIGENSTSPTARAAAAGSQSSDRVRGGKFSNSNVRRRNQSERPARQEESQERPRPRRNARVEEPAGQPRRRTGAQPQSHAQTRSRTQTRSRYQTQARPRRKAKRRSSRGLAVTVVILLIAVIVVGGYIGFRFWRGADAYDKATMPSTEATTPTQTQPVETGVACTDILIEDINLEKGVEFKGMGRAWRLNVTVVPENTTDEITYSSSDESVATIGVNEGRVEILSLAPGTTTITVTCGGVTRQFPVACNFDMPTDSTDPDGQGDAEWELSQSEANIDVDESFVLLLESSSGAIADVTWESDSDGVQIDDNTITGVTSGEIARVKCTYEGQTYECTVRVN